jgi:hypothetical protein
VINRRTPRFDGVLPREEVEDRGNRLDASDADPDACKRVIGGFLSVVRDREGRLYIERKPAERPGCIRFFLIAGLSFCIETPGQTLAASSMAGSTMNAKSIRSTLEAYYGLICIRLAGEDLLESQSQILRQRNGAQQMS